MNQATTTTDNTTIDPRLARHITSLNDVQKLELASLFESWTKQLRAQAKKAPLLPLAVPLLQSLLGN